jgi:4-hydroxybenzoate polyprenyltransferase
LLNTLKLLRIPFSFLLMPIFLLALGQCTTTDVKQAVIVFIIIHLLVYPASNGYNSYVDKDEDSIGGLEKPPLPTVQLLYVTIALDAIAVLLSFTCINPSFGCAIMAYIGASRAYSAPHIRLKKHPLLGFFTVVMFQGGFTYYMCMLGFNNTGYTFNFASVIILIACSFQIAGVYPLTQVYQHKQDVKDGVITLSYKLGYVGTFAFAAIMFALCNVCYYIYFNSVDSMVQFYIIQLFFVPIISYFLYWFLLVKKDSAHANFKNTMCMNAIGAVCMNMCFLILFFLNN